MIDRGKRRDEIVRDEIETSPLTTLRSTHAASIRRPWSGSARARGIEAKIYADLRAELVSLERLPGEAISAAQLTKSYGFSRTPVREALRRLADEGLIEIFPPSAHAAIVRLGVGDLRPYGNSTLPARIRSRIVNNVNGLAIHMLEAGFETKGRRCILLLHGFPELAYSWRKIMLPLAAAGYHVVAPDQRGYGRTMGWDDAYDGDLDSFRFPNLVRDALGLVSALGYRSVAAVVGHDFGSPVAAYCALIRPDVFRSVALMSAPFGGPPQLPFDTAEETTPSVAPDSSSVFEDLTRLDPPRKHYQLDYQTREANDDMWRAPQGVHAFLRAYYHYKSADWTGNKPFKLASFTASELAKMPTYYIMDLNKGMAETAAEHMPSEAEVAACGWLTDEHLSVYADEFARTGFQGGLQWYRCLTSKYVSELETFSGRTIDVPACFIAGKSDWGVYQFPGALERMETTACPQWRGTHLVDGAGHWVQQEQPEEVSRLLLQFIDG